MADTLTAPANYIAGEWRPSAGGDTYEKRNPARPDEVVGEFPSSAREDVDLAVEAAAAALPPWSRGPPAPRPSAPPPPPTRAGGPRGRPAGTCPGGGESPRGGGGWGGPRAAQILR